MADGTNVRGAPAGGKGGTGAAIAIVPAFFRNRRRLSAVACAVSGVSFFSSMIHLSG